MYERVLVPLDGSDFAANALLHASAIARWSGAKVFLVRVIPTTTQLAELTIEPQMGEAETSQDVLVSRRHDDELLAARGYLGRVSSSLTAEGLTVETAIREGSPETEIIAEARGKDANLIVLTAYGDGGAHTRKENAVFGGVADSILRDSRIPVLVIRP